MTARFDWQRPSGQRFAVYNQQSVQGVFLTERMKKVEAQWKSHVDMETSGIRRRQNNCQWNECRWSDSNMVRVFDKQ
jgi:hypothetical protein